MAGALATHFADLRERVSWRVPAGGFFMPVTLPFEFGPVELRRAALDYGVIVCPMRLFSLGAACARQIRLSFSYVDPPTIEEGIARLSAFVRDQLREGA